MRSIKIFIVLIFFQRAYLTQTALLLSLVFISCGTTSNSASFTPYSFKQVPSADTRQYVMMNDSSIVYGEKVVGWGDGLLNKRVVRLDGKSIPASEVLGFQTKGGYWTKLEYNAIAKRLITGRISVYRQVIDVPGGARRSMIFFQKAGGPVREISGMGELKQMLSDCPKAYNMINIPEEEYKKMFKKQPYYTQTVIETYNNCGEWR